MIVHWKEIYQKDKDPYELIIYFYVPEPIT